MTSKDNIDTEKFKERREKFITIVNKDALDAQQLQKGKRVWLHAKMRTKLEFYQKHSYLMEHDLDEEEEYNEAAADNYHFMINYIQSNLGERNKKNNNGAETKIVIGGAYEKLFEYV